MVDEKKQVDEIKKMLMDVQDAVTYEQDTYRIYTGSPYQHEIAVSSNNGRVTIDYNKLANAVHKYSCIKVREMAKKILQELYDHQYTYTERYSGLEETAVDIYDIVKIAKKIGVEVK